MGPRTLVAFIILLLVQGFATEDSSRDKRDSHTRLYGFKCEFPEEISGTWLQFNAANVRARINKQHIHFMGRKFRCIDEHRDYILVKEEKAEMGLTCLQIHANADSATMAMTLRKYYPEASEVRIDWRDDCRNVDEQKTHAIYFTRA